MTEPEDAEAPVIPPILVPNVQEKELGTLADKVILGLCTVAIVVDVVVVITGDRFTVTVIFVAAPAQKPVLVDVGVTIYTIEPAVVLLGLVRVWAILVPVEADAPVIEPVFVPNVQAKVLAAFAVKLILVVLPLQTVAVVAVVNDGVTFTDTVIFVALPTHEPMVDVGVTA